MKEQVKDGSSSDLKIIDIRVEEQPTGEISAGAGIGTMEEALLLMFKKTIG